MTTFFLYRSPIFSWDEGVHTGSDSDSHYISKFRCPNHFGFLNPKLQRPALVGVPERSGQVGSLGGPFHGFGRCLVMIKSGLVIMIKMWFTLCRLLSSGSQSTPLFLNEENKKFWTKTTLHVLTKTSSLMSLSVLHHLQTQHHHHW
jgi:hypothetical protein